MNGTKGCWCARGAAARLTQRWEASLWLAGKQMYLGGFVAEEDAAHAYDLAALACKGLAVPTNFAPAEYQDSLAEVSGSSRVRRMHRLWRGTPLHL